MECTSANDFVEDASFFNNHFFEKATFCWPLANSGGMLKARNQGATDCCYAFVAINTLYAEQFINKKGIAKGSEQEFLDCLHEHYPPKDYNPLHEVPKRGYPNQVSNAFKYVKEHGMYSELQYPWKGEYQGFRGALFDPDTKYFVEGHEYIKKVKTYYDNIDQQLHKQLLSAAVRMTNRLSYWKGTGVFQLNEEELKKINEAKKNGTANPYGLHAVTLVGYGVEEGVLYYIIQNSYRPNWGFMGYAKVEKSMIGHVYYPSGSKKHKRKNTTGRSM